MNLQDTFNSNWSRKFYRLQGKTVLLAVSGGIDSMVMAALFRQAGIPFAIAHCNFQLRGADSDQDEALVQHYANTHHIPFHHIRFDTEQQMAAWKKPVQETARKLRYDWFYSLLETNGYAAIATAHHANDNVETVLMHLFKGTGLAGLHGIPEQNDKVIRPMLFALKDDIAAYAAAAQVTYREDASNQKDLYTRNLLRNQVVSNITTHFPQAVARINESISRFAQAEQIYSKAIAKELGRLQDQRGKDVYIPVLKLQKMQALETICYELFTPYGFTAAQVPQIQQLLQADSGRYVANEQFRVIRNRNFLVITTAAAADTDLVLIDTMPATISLGNQQFSCTPVTQTGNIPQQPGTAWIDADKISQPLLLRRWKTGDYFYPFGMKMKKKKLSRFFIDQKIPLHQKEQVWVLESDKRIVWVCGLRIDERFKVTEQTKNVLELKLI